MQTFISSFLIYFLIFFPGFINAQIIVSGTSKPAACNALGEVTLTATGGNGTYSYRVASNTCSEGLLPAQSSNVFKGLSSCTYIFEATDSDGKRGATTVVVGGSYFSPLVTAGVDKCTISVTATQGQGPYKYELSNNSGNTWETSTTPIWTKKPKGNYLIRVTDACNVSRLLIVNVNLDPITYITDMGYALGSSSKDSFYIYDIHGVDGPYSILLAQGSDTIVSINGRFSLKDLKPKICDNAKIIIRHACGDDIQRLKLSLYSLDCISFANGTVQLNPLYGVQPYSFLVFDESGMTKTSSTGLFNDIVKNSSYIEIKGKDACGDLFYIQNFKSDLRIRPEFFFKTQNDCAALHSATLKISHSSEEPITADPDHYTVECITCIPTATYNVESDEEITINNLGSGTNTILIKDNCGSVWTCKSSLVLAQYIGCDSVSFHLTNSFICDNRPDNEHSITGDSIANTTYTLKNALGQIIATNSSGQFGGLAKGNYTVEADANGCPMQQANFAIATSNVKIELNVGLNRNKNLQAGDKCETVYTLSVETTYEPYILKNAQGKNMGDGNRFQIGSLTWFDLPPGKYSIKSLLNCTVREFELPDLRPTLKIIDFKNCPPGNSITLSGGKNWLEWNAQLHKDYDLNLFYYRNPADWYDSKLMSEFNSDTSSHTFFNLVPNKRYTFYLYSAFSDFGIASTCPLDSVIITIPTYAPPEIKPNFSFFCDQDNRGLMQFTVNHGSGPFSLQQTDASFNTNIGVPVITNDSIISYSGLSKGIHYFKLTDACGKSTSVQSSFSNPDSISAFKNCDGSILLSFYPMPGARYVWTDGNTVVSDSASVKINNPKNGAIYHLNFSFNNCQSDKTYTINTANLNSFSATINSSKLSNTLCEGDSITLTAVFAGSQPNSILWNTGAITNRITVSRMGDYSVQASNATSCMANAAIRILGSAKIITNLSSTNITCFGRNDGMINGLTSGGTPPLTFQWSNGSLVPNIQNLSTGLYTLKVTDVAGCTSSASAQINEPAAIALSPTIKNQTCAGLSDGSIALHVTGGTNPYTYEWKNNSNKTDMITGLTANSHAVKVTDAMGCTAIDSFLIIAPDKITSDRNDTICLGDSIRVGGKFFRKAGEYSIVLPSSSGCDTLLSIHLKEYTAVDFALTKVDVKCFGDHDGSIHIDNLNSMGPYQYMVNGVKVPNPLMNNLSPGLYNVNVSDLHGCKTEKSISISNPEKVTVDLGVDTTIRFGDSLKIKFNTNIDRAVIKQISYTVNNTSPCAGCSEFNYTPNISTNVIVRIETNQGCISQDEQSIQLIPTYRIFAPNILSSVQLQDIRENHVFTIYGGKELTNILYLRIFNRWGDQVFEAMHIPPNDPGYGWDGTFKGNVALPGVYLYNAKLEFKDGSTKAYQGDITIVR
ncbi:MAG: gliding motility-associated C-terminal domain-containing protein [Saprospiraceae bacterium]